MSAALDLTTLTLTSGGHENPDDGMCLLEAVSYVAGEKFTDQPACASPILGSFGRNLNDTLSSEKRQLLKPFIPLIVGTADDGYDHERGLMAADWLIRTYTPTWLRLAGLEDAAVSLETLPRQATWDDVEAAVPVVRAAREKARTARAAAGAAAWAAAGDAARAAARAAAGDAARAAAWDAARAAAWAAAGAAAWDAARAAAWDAAGDAAGAAAGDAAGDAARDALQPTVDLLQDSAIELYGRMVTLGKSVGAA